MASPSYTQDLLDKIRALPDDKIAEVADFVDHLRARRADAPLAAEELEARAAATGLLRLPEPHAHKLSTAEAPPVHVGGKPASEMVVEDRR